jgi:hypothetical protein
MALTTISRSCSDRLDASGRGRARAPAAATLAQNEDDVAIDATTPEVGTAPMAMMSRSASRCSRAIALV